MSKDRRREIELSLFIDDLIDEGIITPEELGEEMPNAFKRIVEWKNSGSISQPYYTVRKVKPEKLNKIMSILAARSGKIRPSLIVYSKDEIAINILIERAIVSFRKNTRQFEICSLLFEHPDKTSWSWDELAEEIGEDPTDKTIKERIYKAYYEIAQKLNVHAPELILKTHSEVSVNPAYEIRRAT